MPDSTTYGTNGDDVLSGGNGKDTIYGLDGNDIISGGNGIDNLFGDGGNDQLTGDNGADHLTGGADDDVLDGALGFDTAYYSGAIGEYSFFSAAGYLHIVHLGGAGADGHDRVVNVERLVFADRTIDIGSGKNAPVAGDDFVSLNEDSGPYSSGSASVLDNDFDFDGDALTVTGGTFVGTYGTLTLNSDGTYSYTLNNGSVQGLDDGEFVADSFNYTVSDNDGSDTGTLTFTIAGLNDAPVANDDTASTTEDAAVSGNVLGNDTDIDGEPLGVANPGTYVGAYGTLVLAADGSYAYTPNTAANALDDGEAVNDAFGYTASDGTASDAATLTITVNGANDAPVANDDTASTDEDAAGVSGNVLTNDTDVDGETLTVANPGTFVGTYGTLVLAADGSYSYTPDAAAQELDTGEIGQDVFGYSATDGTDSDAAMLTVDVAGLNDAPVANDDTAATFENAPVSGNVLANDTDVDVETLTVTNPGTYIGAYGTLVLAANGSYTYTPTGAAQALDEGEVVDDVFGYVASDGTASDAAILTITVTGLGGVPDAVDDTNSTTEDASVSGNVLTNDTDEDLDPLTVSNPGTYVGAYGTLTLAANGSYTYTPDAAADGLAAGETAQDAFSYTATDGTLSDSAALTITVNGTNDAPTIDAGGTDASGSVAELPDGDPNEGTAVHTESGTVAFEDLDLSDTHSASFTPQGIGYLGTFTLDPVDQPGDSVDWDFTVSDAALEGLSEGQIRIQTYEVEIDDGNGGIATQDVTITITGAGVGAGPQTVWFIDNSAVGSANIGTFADPYTSIAAFNAAQGTLGGPQIGHTVHLLAGTGAGVYAEADGINLLNDQILVGDATGPIRPTIVTTAGDGINVAQNNNISGIDLGDTSGADIADSGGTVGNLVIADVASSGTGRIIDIDQGGTLNVTLTSAESLGSSGGAVDLAGVAGSFTVTGATTITGVHSGGGIDITGSSLTATFAGGGTIATLTTTAVNFVGNTGTLALDGGFDLITTTGAGLNASGGGTVTVTGSGNTVTSLGGVAINVNGTAIGAADLTFESVSANGGAYGIRLNSTGSAGELHVTGTGSIDGSGGTIQNTTTRGIELINTAGVVVDNVVLTNANTANGTSTDLDVSNSNAAIFMSGVAGATFGNVDISTAADSGVVGINVADFVMEGSTITLAGNALNESGMEFVNLSGDSSVSDTTISFSETNALDIVNTDVNLNLVLDNVSFSDSQTTSSGGPANPNGEGGLQFRSFSTAAGAPVTNIDVIDSDFTRIRTQGIQLFGNDDSIISLDVTNNVFDSQAGIGTAIDLNASGTSQLAFNVIGNTIASRSGNAINVTAFGGGDVEGRINDNVITANTSGSGIRVVAQDNGSTAIVEARDNGVTMGTGNSASAIDVLARFGNARLDLTLDGNTLDSNTTALADINITAGASASGEIASVYANIVNNAVLAGGPTNVLRLRTADLDATSDPRIFLDGFIEAGPGLDDDAVATWNANGNTPVVTATNVVVTQTAGATSPSAGTALVPDNAEPLMAQSLAGRGASGGELLDQAALATAVDAAIQRFSEAGVSTEQLATIRGVSFAVADLAGLDLGLHTGEGVLIDGDAAGYGWSLDAGGSGMDLLSVVMHELGHAIGFGDHYSAAGRGDLMHGYLALGDQRSLDGLFETGASGQADWGGLATSQPDVLSHYQEMILM